MSAMLEQEKEEEGDRDKCDDNDDNDNNDNSLPIMEFTNINSMEIRGINSYIIKIIAHSMARYAADEGNELNEYHDNFVVGGDDNDDVNDAVEYHDKVNKGDEGNHLRGEQIWPSYRAVLKEA